MIIQHNLFAMAAANNYKQINGIKQKHMEKLSSGYRINRAADDAAKLSISEKMRGQIRGLSRASRNVQEGITFCNVADGAASEVNSILHRMKELCVQASNGTYTDEDRQTINEEIEMLKKEINSIDADTQYNTIDIFKEDYVLEFSDNFELDSFEIWNAADKGSGADPNDPATYGGIIFDGNDRYSWVDLGVMDAVTGKFLSGTHTYTHKDGTVYKFTFAGESCPPNITIEYEIKADKQGIHIGNKTFPWGDVQDEDYEKLLSKTGSDLEGMYHFRAGDAEGGFYVPQEAKSLQDIIDGINSAAKKQTRIYKSTYDGYHLEQSADIDETPALNCQVDQILGDSIRHGNGANITNFGYIKADENGIYVSSSTDSADEVAGSRKGWDELLSVGVKSWDSLDSVSEGTVYQYNFNGAGTGNISISMEFLMTAETSLQSVIDAINNVPITKEGEKTSNTITADEYQAANGSGLLRVHLASSSLKLDLTDEAMLDRDFDVKEYDFGKKTLVYDDTSNSFTLTYQDFNGADYLTFHSNSVSNLDSLKKAADGTLDYFTQRRIKEILTGKTDTGTPDLSAYAKVEANAGYLSNSKEITAGMTTTKNLKQGVTYPSVEIDFSDLGTAYQLEDLLGTGFNSTCATCDNHYSVQFAYGGATAYTKDGYGYSYVHDGLNYYLVMDVKTLMEKRTEKEAAGGTFTGADLAAAMVDIMKTAGMDFHYNQYAADGARFYVMDDRPNLIGTDTIKHSTFDTAPFGACNWDYSVSLSTGQGSSMKLNYTYNISNQLKGKLVTIEDDQNGDFIEDVNGKLRLYDPNDTIGVGEKRVSLAYDGNMTEADWESIYDAILKDSADNTNIGMETTDYAYIGYAMNENEATTVVSEFAFEYANDRKFWIQGGANENQGLFMSWDSFPTHRLCMATRNVLTFENAQDMMTKVDEAVKLVSGIRGTFGAYTNRLEHMYAYDTNAEENLQSAESVLRDADMAEEMVGFSKANILAQAVQSILVQANQSVQGVLSLLQ